MDETLVSPWNRIPLVGGHTFSNDEIDACLGSEAEGIDEMFD